MSNNCYTFPIVLNAKSFKDFIIFDSKTKQRRFKTIVALAVTLFMLSVFCFASVESFDFADTLGCILVAFSVILPTWYFNSFRNTIKQQTAKMNLKNPRHVYTVRLHSDHKGVELYYPDEKSPAHTYKWDSICGAWRSRNAIYLYVTDTQALLIPDYVSKTPDKLWDFLSKHLDKKKLHRPLF